MHISWGNQVEVAFPFVLIDRRVLQPFLCKIDSVVRPQTLVDLYIIIYNWQ